MSQKLSHKKGGSGLVHKLFEHQAEKTPEAVAVEFDGESLTYRELNSRANQIAFCLGQIGVGPEVLVGIFLNRSAHIIAGILGILKAGGAYVPLDPDSPRKRVEFMLEDAKMPVVLTERKLAGLVSLAGCKVLCIEDLPTNTPDENLDVAVRPDHLAYIIYTSGSTGNPKGAMVTHHNVVRLFQTTEELFHFNENDVWTMFHSHAFDFSVWEIWGALFYGGRLVIVPYLVSRSPEAFYDLLCASKVTVLNQTPSAFKQLIRAEAQRRDFPALALRYIIFAGEALYPHTLKPWFDRHGDSKPQLVNMYGITETTVHVTYRPLSVSDLDKSSVIGIPIPDLRVYLLDEERQPVQDGQLGEIYVGGEGVARGYLNRPELTSDRFLADPDNPKALMYKSGDLARRLPTGELEFLGRADKQVKIRGFRVELGEIEAALAEIGGVQQVAVIAREDAADDKRLAAYIVPQRGMKINPCKIRSILGQRLPSYMLPAWFVSVESLPLNHNGKLDAAALPDPVRINSTKSEIIQPRTREEREIAAIWCDVLRIENVGANDNFFELGGHSLIAVQVISRIRTKFGVELPLHAVFETPTISELAKRLVVASEKKAPSVKVERNRAALNPPLSFAQQYLWFLHKLTPQSAAYNLPCAMRLTGKLDISALTRSLNEIIRRHDTLRASFPNNGDTPIQVIAPCLAVPLPVSDLSERSRELAEAEVQSRISSDALAPFDLSTGPLIRFSLLRVCDEEHVLIINLHHMVADGWSLSILFKELAATYEAFSEQKPSPLPELSIQYTDFAVWQRSRLSGARYEQQLAYWRKQLHSAPILDLPSDHPRKNQGPGSSGQQSITASSELRDKINALSCREGATLFMTLLSAFALVLFRRTGQDDICIGSPTAGRNAEEFEKLIGFFNNTIVLRTSLEGDPPFRELLGRVRKICLEAFENQDIPFAKLVEELNPERSGNQTPFFQIFFNLLNYENDSVELRNLSFQPLSPNEVSSKFDLTVYAKEERGTLRFTAVYNADLFDAPQVAELLRQLNVLLEQAVDDPDQRLSEYSLVTKESRSLLPDPTEKLAVKWNGFVHERFSEQASLFPSKTAIFDPYGHWTYSELDRASNRLANALIEHKIGSGDIVAVYGHRSAILVSALLGILKAGAGFLILDPAYPCSRLTACIAIAKPAAFLGLDARDPLSDTLKASVDGICGKKSFSLLVSNQSKESLWAEFPSEKPVVHIGADDVAYVAFTSGSTGTPKGIAGTHRPLSHFIAWHSETFGLGADDRFSMLSGLSHDPLLRDIFTPLWLGGTLCIPPYENIHTPGWVAGWLQRMKISVMHVTPAMVELICESSACIETQSPDLRYAFFGGDCLTKRHIHSLLRHAPAARGINFYGTTETPQAISYFVVDQDPEKNREVIPLGRGISDAQLLILNGRRKLAGIGEIGEIFVRTPYLSMGYLDDNGQTRERFLNNPFTNDLKDRLYRTGDLGRYLPNGTVEFAGRADRQLKIRGFRIEPGEIERVIHGHKRVKQCHVACRGENEHKRLVAYVVLSTNSPSNVKTALRTYLAKQLPQYSIPDQFVFVDEIPLTPNGKVDSRRLPCPEKLDRGQANDLPVNELQIQLVKIWEDVLGHSPIGIKDNFFHIGGHSLLAVRLFVRLKQVTGKALPLAVLFQAPTIEQLALALCNNEWADAWNTLVPIKPNGKKPPLFCLHAVGGNVLSYHDLAAQLDHDQPVYGLQAKGLDGRDIKFSTLEDMASRYIAEIRTVWPKGPYLLAGLSTGGLVAYEMAQQLRSQGENVALLVLFDTFPLIGWRRSFPRRCLGHFRILCQLPWQRKFLYVRDKVLLVSDPLRRWFANFIETKEENICDPLETILEKVRETNRQTLNKYRPKNYSGKTVLFQAAVRQEFYEEFYYEPEEGWDPLVANMKVRPTPGDHGQILANPNVHFLARDLQVDMDQAVKDE